jgi:hypothetical protein
MNIREPRTDLEYFFRAYLYCALWSSTDDDGDPLDSNYEYEDFSAECLAESLEDCRKFLELAGEFSDYDRAGHDFWLSRNGHGSGFFDSPEIYGEERAEFLQKESGKFPEVDLYIGDDGKIY